MILLQVCQKCLSFMITINKSKSTHVSWHWEKKPQEWQKRVENDEEIWRKWRDLRMIEDQEMIENDERFEKTWRH